MCVPTSQGMQFSQCNANPQSAFATVAVLCVRDWQENKRWNIVAYLAYKQNSIERKAAELALAQLSIVNT